MSSLTPEVVFAPLPFLLWLEFKQAKNSVLFIDSWLVSTRVKLESSGSWKTSRYIPFMMVSEGNPVTEETGP